MAEDIVDDRAIDTEDAIEYELRGGEGEPHSEPDRSVVDQWESHEHIRSAESSAEHSQEPDGEIRGGHAEGGERHRPGGEPRGDGVAGRHWDDRGEAHGRDGRQGQAQGGEIDSSEGRTVLLAEAVIRRSQQKIDARNEETRAA